MRRALSPDGWKPNREPKYYHSGTAPPPLKAPKKMALPGAFHEENRINVFLLVKARLLHDGHKLLLANFAIHVAIKFVDHGLQFVVG